MSPKPSVIAIDGPVAAGKTAVSALLAVKMGYRFIDTGVMYRAITWAVLRAGLDPDDQDQVSNLARATRIEVTGNNSDGGERITVDGEDVTSQLRTQQVESNVARVSKIKGVRVAMVSLQRAFAESGKIVMAGRDIGTVVLPNAPLKIFITASAKVRAQRRYLELTDSGQSPEFQQVLNNLLDRDKLDTERATSPLRPDKDAHILNTDDIQLDEVVGHIISLAEAI